MMYRKRLVALVVLMGAAVPVLAGVLTAAPAGAAVPPRPVHAVRGPFLPAVMAGRVLPC